MKLLYYVTSHGYGHATRSAAVMNALLALRPDLDLCVRSGSPEWVFRTSIAGDFNFEHVELDIGVVERGALSQDAEGTLQRCQNLSEAAPKIIENETAFIRSHGVRLVIGDIPPLAPRVALEAKVPIIAIGNFSWDHIYSHFLPDHPGFGAVIQEIRDWYATTHLLLRLPWHHQMDAFPAVEPIPLVARIPQVPAEVTRQLLAGAGVNVDRPVILIAGRFPDLKPSALQPLLDLGQSSVLSFADLGVGSHPNFTLLDSAWQPRFLDVLHASDCAVSKLGYGIAAECVSCRTRILYPPREDFLEHAYIEADLPNHVPTERIERPEFEAGAWIDPLDRLLAKPVLPLSIPIDGASVAAERIVKALDSGFC